MRWRHTGPVRWSDDGFGSGHVTLQGGPTKEKSMKQTVAALVAKTLESAGVKRIWGVTGDSLNGLSDSLNRMGTIWCPCD